MDLTFCCRRWRRWIGFLVVILYAVALLIALPLCIWELEKKNASDHVEAWFVGGMFVLMALPISFWGILQHVINYTQPYLQRHIIRILWMVPIYAVNAWFALRFPSAAIYLDTLRECYEAYVIYNFMAYLLSFLHNEYPYLEFQLQEKPPVKHLFPLCWFPPCENGIPFLLRCKHGVLQYTVIRPLMTVIALVCEIVGVYGEGDLNFSNAWSYIVLINNASQIVAMYCLVLFYQAFKQELQPLKPVPKFLCVKAVVFVSFWQALVIAILAKVNVIPQNGPWLFYKNVKEVSTGIQDFLICIEMFLAALAHYYSFSHKPFVNMAAEQQNCCESFLSMWNVSDVTEDVFEHARYIGRGVHQRFNRSGERTPLLRNNSSREVLDGQNAPHRSTPSPAVVLQGEEAKPFDFDSVDALSDSFAFRSTTQSMNNFAQFSELSTSVEVTKDASKGVASKDSASPSSISKNKRVKGASGLDKSKLNKDDHFEEIKPDEAADSDSEDLFVPVSSAEKQAELEDILKSGSKKDEESETTAEASPPSDTHSHTHSPVVSNQDSNQDPVV